MGKNEIKQILAERLNDLMERKRDIDYKLSDKKQAQQMDIPYNTFNNYRYATSECPISALVKMAKYFHVSTDYLLGLQREPTNDPDVIAITEYTGLSPESIDIITAINDFGYKHIVERVINNEFFGNLISECKSIEALSEEIQEIINGDEYKNFQNEYKLLKNEFLKSKDENITIKMAKILLASEEPMCDKLKNQIDLERYKIIKYTERLMNIFDCRANKEEKGNGNNNPANK